MNKLNDIKIDDKAIDINYLSNNYNLDDYRIRGENDKAEYRKYLNYITISSYLRFTNAHCINANTQSIGLKQKIERILEVIRAEQADNK